MKQSLPNTPIRLADESRLSIFVRAAIGNGWSLHSLSRVVLGTDDPASVVARIYDDRDAALFAASLGIPSRDINLMSEQRVTHLRAAGFRWNGLNVKLGDLRRTQSAICPLCLREDVAPYLRTRWEHSFSETCALHQCALVDTCPSCLEPLDVIRGVSLYRCKCRRDLRQIPPEPSETRDAQLSERAIKEGNSTLLETALDLKVALAHLARSQGENPKGYRLSNLAARMLDNPLEFANLFPGRGPQLLSIRLLLGDPSFRSSDRAFQQLMAVSAEKGQGFIHGDWQHFLEGRISKTSAERVLGIHRTGVNRLLKNGLIRCIKDSGSSGREMVTLASLNAFLISLKPDSDLNFPEGAGSRRVSISQAWQHLPKVSTSQIQSLGFHPASGLRSLIMSVPLETFQNTPDAHLSVEEVARLANVHSEYIRSLCSVGFLASTRDCKKPIRIARATAEAFIDRYSFAGPLARKLGIKQSRITERIWDQGVIPVSGPAVDGSLCYLFERLDLEALDVAALLEKGATMRRFERSAGQHVPPKDAVSLAIAAGKLGISVQIALGLIRNGTLIRMPSITRARFVSQHSLNEVLARINDPALIPLSMAAQKVAESESEFRRRWISTEVAREVVIAKRRFVSRIDLQKVEALKQEFDVAAEVGSAAGLQRTHFVNRSRVESSGLTLISIGSEGRRVNLVPKTATASEMTRAFGEIGSPSSRRVNA